jgi:hypothetical protein
VFAEWSAVVPEHQALVIVTGSSGFIQLWVGGTLDQYEIVPPAQSESTEHWRRRSTATRLVAALDLNNVSRTLLVSSALERVADGRAGGTRRDRSGSSQQPLGGRAVRRHEHLAMD